MTHSWDWMNGDVAFRCLSFEPTRKSLAASPETELEDSSCHQKLLKKGKGSKRQLDTLGNSCHSNLNMLQGDNDIIPSLNSSPPKIDGWKINYLLGDGLIFKGELLVLGRVESPFPFTHRWPVARQSFCSISIPVSKFVHLSGRAFRMTLIASYCNKVSPFSFEMLMSSALDQVKSNSYTEHLTKILGWEGKKKRSRFTKWEFYGYFLNK